VPAAQALGNPWAIWWPGAVIGPFTPRFALVADVGPADAGLRWAVFLIFSVGMN